MNKNYKRIIFSINFLIATFLSFLAQDYSREHGRIDFRRSCDALTREIPCQISTCFDNAFSEIRQMLIGEKELSFKRAVFLVENCYYEGKLNWDEYDGEINRIKFLLYRMIKQRGLENYKTCGNWAVFTYMSDSINENGYKPYTYDIENFMNDNDRCSYMVTNLLKTRKGNCRALPYMYKILANELGAEAYIAIVPMHCYVKHRDENGKWWNLEMTAGSFSRSSFIMETFNVSETAIESGLYMKGLNEIESVAYCLVDLLSFYEWKTGRYSDDFVRKCYTLGLQYFPVSQLQIWKANDLQFQIGYAINKRGLKSNYEILDHPDLYALYLDLYATIQFISEMGYSTIKQDDYERLVRELREKQEHLKE